MKISDVLHAKESNHVITIDIAHSIQEAADLMMIHQIAGLVVNRGETPIGVVSERDVVRALSTGGESAGYLPLSEMVSQKMVSIASNQPIKTAMSLMTYNRLRHLPVMDDGELVGIISLGDVVKHRLEELQMESDVRRDLYIASR